MLPSQHDFNMVLLRAALIILGHGQNSQRVWRSTSILITTQQKVDRSKQVL